VTAYTGALEAVDRIINRGGDADDVLRAVVAVLHERLGIWVAVAFVEEGELVPGPQAGSDLGHERAVFPVEFGGARVAELWVDGRPAPNSERRAFLERVATLVSQYCLVGWDTGGERWDP
jgi:hypothetical protein